MAAVLQLRLNCLELGHQPLLRRFAPYDECPIFPALPTVMREAQKREGLRLSLSPPLSVLDSETAQTRSAASSPRAIPGRTSPDAPGSFPGNAPPPLGFRNPPPD